MLLPSSCIPWWYEYPLTPVPIGPTPVPPLVWSAMTIIAVLAYRTMLGCIVFIVTKPLTRFDKYSLGSVSIFWRLFYIIIITVMWDSVMYEDVAYCCCSVHSVSIRQ